MSASQHTIVVGLITNRKGEILLARRNQPDIPQEHNKWEFVGGGIDFGETPEQALVREVKEESGLDIRIIRLLPKVYIQNWLEQNPQRQIIILSYECEVTGGQLKSGDSEIFELKFVPVEEIKSYDCLPNVDTIVGLLSQ